nr:RNA-directed DNA polymerase, eukaryota, reverse transcriptase zinc-binding domain protein [Tanacetum cinerariifolium]
MVMMVNDLGTGDIGGNNLNKEYSNKKSVLSPVILRQGGNTRRNVTEECLIWLEIEGVPLRAWNNDTFT